MSINSESEWQAASQPSSEMGRRRTVLFRSSMPSSPQHSSTVTPTLRASETDPLLSQRPFGRHFNSSFGHTPPSEPTFSCHTNHHSNIPVYTNIHRIKRDIESVVEDYLSLDQLLDVRVNLAVVRPLVDKLDDEEDISIVYCLLVNRVRFLEMQSKLSNRQNVSFTRATLCELVATRILRRWGERNPGEDGLLTLAHILVAGFEPFQGAPEEVIRKAGRSSWSYKTTLPALEVAILSDSKFFLSSTTCQKIIDGIYEGKIVYTPSSFIDLIPDHYKQKPITIYNPREAPLLNQYRLIVPKMRNMLEIFQFVILLGLYLLFMTERDPTQHSALEISFSVYAFSWVLDQFATILEHGWKVYSQNLWSFLDVTFAAIYLMYLMIRIRAWHLDSLETSQLAFDVLAMGAPVLIPRLAFNLLSNNLVFVSLRSMMADFTLLTLLSLWCFAGFFISMIWLGEGQFGNATIAKWMLWIWFGLDGTGITESTEFHWLLGPTLMVTFTFLGNTLFLTILVSMLSHTFSTIVSNATAEIMFRKAVLTLEGVKSDAIFAYQPPFNLIAFFVFLPLKFIVSPRWFHKIHVFSVRTLNLPLLLLIALAERRIFRSRPESKIASKGLLVSRSKWYSRWRDWRITTHSDLDAVFEIEPPRSIQEDIARDDDVTKHLIRRQFGRSNTNESTKAMNNIKPLNRRDSMFPQLSEQVRASMSTSNAEEAEMIGSRIMALEYQNSRIERMLEQICDSRGIELDEEVLETISPSRAFDPESEGSPSMAHAQSP